MKYKWKDKVRIKSKKELECISEVTDNMLKNGGAIMTIACLVEDADGYIMKEDGDFHFLWTDEMIEGLVEDEMSLNKAGQITDFEYEGLVYTLPEGYIFKDENGNVINATKIILEKKKKEYPKTYEECCKVLEWNHRDYDRVGYKSDLLCKLQVLLLCRDAYWKIAGEEMGLGKPWEPDWADTEIKYCIANSSVGIKKSNTYDFTRILSFPTKEMRDAFYENFKELINSCKELL